MKNKEKQINAIKTLNGHKNIIYTLENISNKEFISVSGGGEDILMIRSWISGNPL